MRIEAVIFDLDGVICSTDQYHYQAWRTIADRLGIPFDERVNARLRGVGRMESLEIVLGQNGKNFSQEEKERLAEEKNRIYQHLLQKITPADLTAETSEALGALRALGLKLAVGSSSKNTALILRRLGLDSFFDAVADGTQISRSKPDPEVFLLAASLLRVQPSRALVVEDAPAGIEAAKAGGFLSVGLGDAVHASGPDDWIAALKELPRICFGR